MSGIALDPANPYREDAELAFEWEYATGKWLRGIEPWTGERSSVPHTRGEERGTGPDQGERDIVPDQLRNDVPNDPDMPLYLDVATFLDGGLPEPPAPVLMKREDGHCLFYAAQVNVLFGDPESGKTLVAQAAASEALTDSRRVLFIDIDHNGPVAILSRFLAMGVPRETLCDPALFRYVEPEDKGHLRAVVEDARAWRPAVAVVDSVGELLPLLSLSSNSPDDFTLGSRWVLKPLAMAGAAVLAIDHLPKNTESRLHGQTGTMAKKRATGGVSIRVTINEQFAPGRKGSAWLAINKDRHGGLRRYCPSEGREPSAGLFELSSIGDRIDWKVRSPKPGDAAAAAGVSTDDIAVLDQLDPPPSSVNDVKERLSWGTNRASGALKAWRSQRSGNVPEERGTGQRDCEDSTSEEGVPPVPAAPVPDRSERAELLAAAGIDQEPVTMLDLDTAWRALVMLNFVDVNAAPEEIEAAKARNDAARTIGREFREELVTRFNAIVADEAKSIRSWTHTVPGRGKPGVGRAITTVFHNPHGWRNASNEPHWPFGFKICNDIFVHSHDDRCVDPVVFKVEVRRRGAIYTRYWCDRHFVDDDARTLVPADVPEGDT